MTFSFPTKSTVFSATENGTSSKPGPPASVRAGEDALAGEAHMMIPFLASSRVGVESCSPNLQRAEPDRPSKPGKKKPVTVTDVDSKKEPPIGSMDVTDCG